MFAPIGGGIPRRTLCCRTRCGSHFHSYGFAPWSPQSFLSSRTRGASAGGQRCQRELGPSPAWRSDMSVVGHGTRMCSGSTPTSLMPADQVAEVRIRCYRDVPECEVVVAVRGKEIILRCPDYDQAVKWARVECRSYGIASITAEHDQQSPRFFPAMW